MVAQRVLGFGVFAISLLALHTAHATEPVPVLGLPTVMTPNAPPPAAASSEAPAPAPAASATTDEASTHSGTADNSQCFPACRPGYMCNSGQCVSRCNPPCAAGLECTESLSCVSPTGATASEPAEPKPTKAASPSSDGDRARYHDGFYLQLGLGLSAAGGKAKKFDHGFNDADFTGGGGRIHAAAGFSVVKGLVIGGAFGLEGHDLRVKNSSDDMVFAADSSTTDWLLFSDWYFMPDKGLHAQLGVGPSFGSLKGEGTYFPDQRFIGAGLTALLGVGLEAYISSKWGIGALFQVQVHGLRMEAISTNEDFELGYTSAALLFSATYH